MTRLGTTVALTLLLAAPPPAQSQDVAATGLRVDSMFAVHNTGVRPGLAVAVVRDGRLVFSKGYGMASLEHRVPITPSTVFDVASVSKQFTGLAIAILVDQGRLRLTDDVRKYIPELGDVGHTITLDHLVHHTSGLRDWPGSLSLAGWRMDDVISFDQILRFAYAQRSLNFAPGSEYTYSNTGYNLLAETVSRVSGMSFRQWTDEQLFRPLGMTSSHFHDDVTRMVPNRAYGYARQPDGSYRSITDNLTALGSSSLFSSVEDLAQWVMNFDDPRVGGAAAMALSRTRGRLTDGSPNLYAFGLVHGEYRGQPMVNHSGSWAQFASYVLHLPQLRFGVIVLANSSSVNASRAAFDVTDAFLGTVLDPRSTPSNPMAAGATIAVPVATLDRYAGLYRLGPGWYVRIRRDGTVLRAQATREAEVTLAARSDTSFWVAGYNAPMFFTTNAAGLTSLVYRGRSHAKRPDSTSLSASALAEFTGEYESAELGTVYGVEVSGAGLVLQHRRHGTIPLTRLWNDDFAGSAWFTRSIEFSRDASGRVIGFSVFVDERSRDIRFVKR
jgi:CubicO group peptidase (beta-lactamase class C family)